MELEKRLERLEKKLDKLTNIVLDYLDFWVNGSALKPIYQKFIERTEEIV